MQRLKPAQLELLSTGHKYTVVMNWLREEKFFAGGTVLRDAIEHMTQRAQVPPAAPR